MCIRDRDIPVKMEKFYGKGKMLHPSIEDVEQLVKTIPKGSVTTIEAIGKRLAIDFGTKVTCPMRAGNSIKKIADRYLTETVNNQVPFWRVIRTNKLLVKSKNYELSASKIEDEGFTLLYEKSGAIKLDVEADNFFVFE